LNHATRTPLQFRSSGRANRSPGSLMDSGVRESGPVIVLSPKASYDEKMEAQTKLQKLPRDASPTRQRTRCALTGRPRAVYAKFGLGRNKLREATMRGDVPGLRKSSW